MRAYKSLTLTKIAAVVGLATLALWIVMSNPSGKEYNEPQNVAGVPQQEKPGVQLPVAVATQEPPPPAITPTWTPRPPTTTPVNLQPAVLVTHTVSTAAMAPALLQSAQTTVNSAQAIHSMAWAPTGDKFLYVTNLGGLYWSNTDGTNATLLHQYEPDTIWRMLEDQRPMSNTLLLTHIGPPQGMTRAPGHIDVVHFTPGQAPSLEEVHDAGAVFQIRWWSPTRASGFVAGGYVDHVGAEKLVTLDANGHLVEERNIPYLIAGAVSPGGQWLAYVTDPQSTDTPLYGSDPATVYLLNLTTGERKQITTPGQVGGGASLAVHSWSPDGNWFLIGANVDGGLRGIVVSANGQEWIIATPLGYSATDAVWRPDSQRLAFSIQSGGQEEPYGDPVPYNSEIYIVDIPTKKVSVSDGNGPGSSLPALLMQPKWSPNGSQLAFLSYDPNCDQLCSELSPAIYLLPGQ